MTSPSPRVTVFIPFYNAERFLRHAILSVLTQKYTDFELLTIDDGSTDQSLEVIKEFNDPRIRLVRNEQNLGLPYTRNRGLELANGEYLAVLDADDVFLPDRIAKQVEFLDTHPNVVAVGSWGECIDDDGKVVLSLRVPCDSVSIRRTIFHTNCFIHSSILLRRAEVLDLGGYNIDFAQAQDYELFLRLIEHYDLANLPEFLIQYRVHVNQISQTKLANQRKLADKVRMEAYKRQQARGLLSTETIPPQVSLLNKLCAKESTLGNDLLRWVAFYREAKLHRQADRILLSAFYAAPFSSTILKELWSYHLRRSWLARSIRWYTARIITFVNKALK